MEFLNRPEKKVNIGKLGWKAGWKKIYKHAKPTFKTGLKLFNIYGPADRKGCDKTIYDPILRTIIDQLLMYSYRSPPQHHIHKNISRLIILIDVFKANPNIDYKGRNLFELACYLTNLDLIEVLFQNGFNFFPKANMNIFHIDLYFNKFYHKEIYQFILSDPKTNSYSKQRCNNILSCTAGTLFPYQLDLQLFPMFYAQRDWQPEDQGLEIRNLLKYIIQEKIIQYNVEDFLSIKKCTRRPSLYSFVENPNLMEFCEKKYTFLRSPYTSLSDFIDIFSLPPGLSEDQILDYVDHFMTSRYHLSHIQKQ